MYFDPSYGGRIYYDDDDWKNLVRSSLASYGYLTQPAGELPMEYHWILDQDPEGPIYAELRVFGAPPP
jgi:hypothetical protein